MRNVLALLLALMMCLSLCACGGGNDTPATGQNEQLENNPPSTQETPTETTVPETTTETTVPETTTEPEPVYETIEITIDNWQDYFEFETDEPYWGVNDATNVTFHYQLHTWLVVKDEFDGRIIWDKSELSIKYSVIYNIFHYIDIDWDGHECILGEETTESNYEPYAIPQLFKSRYRLSDSKLFCYGVVNLMKGNEHVDDEGRTITGVCECVIDEISGTITIEK